MLKLISLHLSPFNSSPDILLCCYFVVVVAGAANLRTLNEIPCCHIGQVKQKFFSVKLQLFSYPSV